MPDPKWAVKGEVSSDRHCAMPMRPNQHYRDTGAAAEQETGACECTALALTKQEFMDGKVGVAWSVPAF